MNWEGERERDGGRERMRGREEEEGEEEEEEGTRGVSRGKFSAPP